MWYEFNDEQVNQVSKEFLQNNSFGGKSEITMYDV